MNKFVFKSIAGLAVLSFHLSSLAMIVSHKFAAPQRFKTQSDLIKTARHRAFQGLIHESKAAKPLLLLKNEPENKTFDLTRLPWEDQQHILALSDNKNGLKNTCWEYNEVLSKTTDNFKWIVELPHYPIHKKDVTFLMLQAAWHGKIDEMETILQNTKQREFDRLFSVLFGEYSMLCVSDIVDKKDNKKEYIALGREYGSDFGEPSRYLSEEVNVLMAVYCRDRNRVKVFAKNIPDWSRSAHGCLAFAVDQNNADAIATLSSVIKSQENEYDIHVDFYELLKIAEIENKPDAFEALVVNDPVNCLNSVIPGGLPGRTILDEFVDESYSSKYVEILRKHGAKTYAELHGNGSSWCTVQ